MTFEKHRPRLRGLQSPVRTMSFASADCPESDECLAKLQRRTSPSRQSPRAPETARDGPLSGNTLHRGHFRRRSTERSGGGTDWPMCSRFRRQLAEMCRCVASNRAETRRSRPSAELAVAKPQVRSSHEKPSRVMSVAAYYITPDLRQRTAKYTT